MLECCLPSDQMVEVLFKGEKEKAKLAIAAAFTETGTHLILILADGKQRTVPISIFTDNPVAVPNFNTLELCDYGRTVKFGTYEAAVDFALKY